MKLTQTVEANPNTKIKAHWFSIDKGEFSVLLKSGVNFKTSPISNGLSHQTTHLNDGNVLMEFESGDLRFIKFSK